MSGAIHSTGKYSYCTPEEYVSAIRTFFGGTIELDPSTNTDSIVYALDNIVLEELEESAKRKVLLDYGGGIVPFDGSMDVLSNEPLRQWIANYRTGDGLTESWAGKNTYCNPPFSIDRRSQILKWVTKAYNEYLANKTQTVLLIPASIETKWYQDIIFPKGDGICWLNKRVTFIGEETGIPKPLALIYFGDESARFCKHFRPFGHTYNPSEAHVYAL